MKAKKTKNPFFGVDIFIILTLIVGIVVFLYIKGKEQKEFAMKEVSIPRYDYIFDKLTLLDKKGQDTSSIKEKISEAMSDKKISNSEFKVIKEVIDVREREVKKMSDLRQSTEDELRKELIKDKLLLLKKQ